MPTRLETVRIHFRESIAEKERIQRQESLNELKMLENHAALIEEQIPELQAMGPFGTEHSTGLRWAISGTYGNVLVEIRADSHGRVDVFRSNGSGREENTLQSFNLKFYPLHDSSATQRRQETIERSRQRAVAPIIRHIALLLEKP